MPSLGDTLSHCIGGKSTSPKRIPRARKCESSSSSDGGESINQAVSFCHRVSFEMALNRGAGAGWSMLVNVNASEMGEGTRRQFVN